MSYNDLVIINNEKISNEKNGFYCDNIDIKSIPENLNKNFNVTVIARNSKVKRSHQISLETIEIASNIFSFLSSVLKTFKKNKASYLIIFLKYNFPKAKVFLGDGGSYLLGAFIAISTIKTSILNPTISPFYFCILLFYLFFEVFFSFFRKLIKEKISPIHPDRKHLHMLLYKILLKKNNDNSKSNYSVSIIINLTYLILIMPAIFMMNNSLFCKYYSLVFFITYIFSYKIASKKVNKKSNI